MAVTIRVEKHPLKDFQPSRYCEWCVTVDNDAPGGWDGPRQWAIDLPGDTDILDPEIARKIKGAPKYTVDPGEGQGTITRPHAKSFKICFVAACEERKGTVDLSLESRFDAPTGGGVLDPPPWERVPFEGGPNGLGKIVGP